MRKQIAIFVPLEEWLLIRREAAKKDIPMTELCRRMMSPEMEKLKVQDSDH